MKKEILQEIEHIAPRLLQIGNRNPFKVPDSYFENLGLEADKTVYNSDENVPDGYFENLSDEVLIKAKSDKSARVISLSAKRWIAAASIVLLCTASYFTISTHDSTGESESFALDVELEEAFDYLADNDDIDLSEILELGEFELIEEMEVEYNDMDIDLFLDEVGLDDLDELLL